MTRTALVTGATGYIGGRLVPELLAAGWAVRVLARHPERLRDRPWAGRVEVVAGDAEDPGALAAALRGADAAYYLLHSLQTGPGFEDAEERTARAFAAAASQEGVGRIVYLGGLLPADRGDLSPHLRSRGRVGEVLRASGVPTAELRAAVIIGSGSASFEMLRYLTERLPAMVTPRWVRTPTQPIAVRDVLRYLVAAADLPPEVNRAFDVGGPDVLTYAQMMHGYARAAGLRRRLVVPVGVLSPALSSLWVGLVTPVPSGIARPLVESLRHPTVAAEHDIAAWVPDPPGGLVPFERAVALALTKIRDAEVATRWSEASTPGAPSEPLPGDPDWAGGSLYGDVRERDADAPPEVLWQVVEGVGGATGWYSPRPLWELRGLADRLVGGVGLRRGRRDPVHAYVGDAVDFWRVEERDPPRLLRLRAEMRLPGLAWLEFTVTPAVPGGSRLRQRAVFHPRGLAGHAYWWSVAPFHGLVFATMARRIAAEAGLRAAGLRAAGRAAAGGAAAAGGGGAHPADGGQSGHGRAALVVRPVRRRAVLRRAGGPLLRGGR